MARSTISRISLVSERIDPPIFSALRLVIEMVKDPLIDQTLRARDAAIYALASNPQPSLVPARFRLRIPGGLSPGSRRRARPGPPPLPLRAGLNSQNADWG